MDDVAGKTAVITGAASGIGLAMARRFGEAGMRLVIADIEQPALDDAAAALTDEGHDVATFDLDVRDLDQIRSLEAFAVERCGKVHVLCNNAGVGGGGAVSDPDNLEVWKWTIDINLWGVIYGCKVFLPGMLAHGEPAHIVNTASMAGLASAPMMGAYNISKYGVVALSETLSKEMQLMQTAVGVSVLCPAFVQTSIATSTRNLPDELKPRDTPEDGPLQSRIQSLIDSGMPTEVVAEAVFDAVAHDRFWILTHDEAKPGVLSRAEEIVNGVNPSVGVGFL